MTPLGERSRQSNFTVTIVSYVIGCLIGGAALGAAAGGAGSIVHVQLLPGRPIAWAALAVVGALADLRPVPWLRVPTHRRQVRERWFRMYRNWVYGLGFGVQLGLGFVTVINSSLVYLAALAAFLVGSLPAGLVIGVVFGAARAAALLPAAAVRRPDDLIRMTRVIDELDKPVRKGAATVAGLTAIAVVTLTLV